MGILGVSPGKCIVLGDGLKDLEIIRYVGKGSEGLKRESDFVATDTSNDGIRNALRNFGLIQNGFQIARGPAELVN